MTPNDLPGLSIVTTAFRSASTIDVFVKRALAAAEEAGFDAEVIIVDDGSPDASATLVRDIVGKQPRVRLIKLSRNFGHHKAMLAGLQHAKREFVFLIDSDLEEDPRLLVPMVAQMREMSVDCLYGVQKQRKGGRIERISGEMFYKLFGALSEVELPRNVSTIRLMTQRYVASLLAFRDKNPVFVPLSILAGYPQASFTFEKSGSSETTYSLSKRVSLMFLAITSFSSRPLLLMFYISLVLAFVGLTYGIYVVALGMSGVPRDGWSSLMAVVVFFFSLNAVFTGLIGLYVKQILEEVKDRPVSVVQEVYENTSQDWENRGTSQPGSEDKTR
ncbi:glycosyltransferase family 2 protein [Roseobacter sp. S98]|uniref:glycosyltransferase family 2 protein n=1 Tax=Roseobacter algicola (ex Choi et al. 2025) (nom. illeg.) TaxID=3092138 RepID=UPI0035C7186A